MTNQVSRLINSRYFVWVLLALPMAWMFHAWRTGGLFYGEMVHVTGEFSARLLMLTMAITPFRLMLPDARWPNWLLQRRRYLGVAAFAYALLHTIVYLDRKRSVSLILDEGTEIALLTGWVAFIVFLVLAVTSNDASVRVLRRTWKKIHRWVYLAAALLFAHWILTAFDPVPGLIHFAILMGLETYRLWKRGKLGINAT